MSIRRHLATTLYVLPLLALLSGGNALADEGGDSHLETSCAPVKTFAVKVELANMDRISDMDKDNINALRASLTTLQGLDKVYILGRNHEFGKRTFVIPHEECAAGCIGYIVSNASHGVGVTTFWYRYNVMIEPRIRQHQAKDRLVLLYFYRRTKGISCPYSIPGERIVLEAR